MSAGTLLYEVERGIATITLNRPERMNAFNPDMYRDLVKAFDETDADEAVRAVIVTGSGDRAFCAGADLSRSSATFDYATRDNVPDDTRVNGVYQDTGGIVTLRIFESLKPVIAACNGAAVGVGASMQLAMDIRLASHSARYGFVCARRGIAPEAASAWFLPRIAPTAAPSSPAVIRAMRARASRHSSKGAHRFSRTVCLAICPTFFRTGYRPHSADQGTAGNAQ